MLSDDFQSAIPATNIMYPVIDINDQLPEAYNRIKIPEKYLQIEPIIIHLNKKEWIDEWLNAS